MTWALPALVLASYALMRDTRLDGTRQVPPLARLVPQRWR